MNSNRNDIQYLNEFPKVETQRISPKLPFFMGHFKWGPLEELVAKYPNSRLPRKLKKKLKLEYWNRKKCTSWWTCKCKWCKR